jgi:hypothetical protein
MAVTSLVLEAGGDEKTAIAAFLHDTVEDTLHTFQEIEEVFGSSVAELIREVSEDKKLPKAERKNDYVFRIPTMSKEAPALANSTTQHFYKLVCDEMLDRCGEFNETGNEQFSELICLYNKVFG